MGVEAGLERGKRLTEAGGIGVGPDWFARLWVGSVDRIVDRIDAGLVRGSIEAHLPGGVVRLLGGRAPGFAAAIEIVSWRAVLRLATGGSVGWYQAWEAGEWHSPDPVAIFALFMDNGVALGNVGRARGPWRLAVRSMHWLRRNTRAGARRNVRAHYDLGNDFYAAWLGKTLCYSSAIFGEATAPQQKQQKADPLDVAQVRKLEAIAARLPLGQGKTALEIGCGWGALAYEMASLGSTVDAISLSDEQLAACRDRTEAKGRERQIRFLKQDYRDTTGQYDAIASVEMVEALGREYWTDFMACIDRCLKPGGRAALQFISIRDDLFDAYARSADFIQTYIFPGGLLVRESEFRRLAAERGLEWRDQVNFGRDYAETLRFWRANFDRAVEEGRLPPRFDARFIRLWRYYLMYCEGGFRGGGIDVSQVTLVKPA